MIAPRVAHTALLLARERQEGQQFCRELSSLPIISHWIAWSLKDRYSSFENKAKKEKDTGGTNLACSTTQKRTCLEHQSSGSAMCHLCPLWEHVLVEVRPCHRGTTHFLEVFEKSIYRCSEFTWIEIIHLAVGSCFFFWAHSQKCSC